LEFQNLVRLVSDSPSVVNLKHFLEYTKEKKLMEPALVVRFGKNLIDNHSKALGSDVWGVYERVCMAAVDCYNLPVAEQCHKQLKTKFGKSSRVTILEGLILEAQGQHTQAEVLYDRILKDDATHQAAWKRKICLAKEKGDTVHAIGLLNKFVKLSSADEHAWLELADLYLSLGRFELAKFSIEELLLLCPDNHLYHLKYAEISYTLGGKANVAIARQYYAQSLELKPQDNLRAQYGLIMCLRAKGSNKLSDELHRWCGQDILGTYSKVSDPKAETNFENHQLKFNFGGDEISSPSQKPSSRSATPNANPFLPQIVHASISF
jgi:tetratricopeptide (TPR) repeat protein